MVLSPICFHLGSLATQIPRGISKTFGIACVLPPFEKGSSLYERVLLLSAPHSGWFSQQPLLLLGGRPLLQFGQGFLPSGNISIRILFPPSFSCLFYSGLVWSTNEFLARGGKQGDWGGRGNRVLLLTRVKWELVFLGSLCPFLPKADLPSDSLHHTLCFEPSSQSQPRTGPAEKPGSSALHGQFRCTGLCKVAHEGCNACGALLRLYPKQCVPTGSARL